MKLFKDKESQGDSKNFSLATEDELIGKRVYLPERFHGEKNSAKNPVVKVKKILFSGEKKLVLLEDGTVWGANYVSIEEE